jgi:hypothetical protein
MRQRNTVLAFLFYMAAMCLLAYTTISFRTELFLNQSLGISNRMFSGMNLRISDIGSSVFQMVILLQAFLVLALAPSMTSGLVKGEKEKETFEFLRATTITPFSYLFGALMSSQLYVALSLLCAFPVLSLAYLYGRIEGLFPVVVSLLSISTLLSSYGLMVSASAEKLRTTANQGGVGFGVGIGVLAIYLTVGNLFGGGRGAGLMGLSQSLLATGPLGIPVWVLLVMFCLIGSGLFLLVAHRKFFAPEERALNFSQTLGVALGAVGLALAVNWQGLFFTALTPVGRTDALAALLSVLYLLGAFAPVLLCITRLKMGDERWHLRNRYPQLRRTHETTRQAITIQIPIWLFYSFLLLGIHPDNFLLAGLLSLQLLGVFFLMQGLARFLLTRTPYVSQAANWCRTILAFFTLVPLLTLFLVDGNDPAGSLISELGLALVVSPAGALLLSTRLPAEPGTLILLSFSATLAILSAALFQWLADRTPDPHATEIIAYQDGELEEAH